jgi:hypothetical protein
VTLRANDALGESQEPEGAKPQPSALAPPHLTRLPNPGSAAAHLPPASFLVAVALQFHRELPHAISQCRGRLVAVVLGTGSLSRFAYAYCRVLRMSLNLKPQNGKPVPQTGQFGVLQAGIINDPSLATGHGPRS